MEKKEMDFGKRYRIGNFEVLKITRALSKKDLNILRDDAGIPKDVRKHLSRGGLPYILVNTISGGWSLSLVCGTEMYRFIEFEVMNGDEGANALTNLFTMMYSDTAILGDDEYHKAKAAALKAYMERVQAKKVSQEEDDKELESLENEENARATILDMAEQIKKEDDHEGK